MKMHLTPLSSYTTNPLRNITPDDTNSDMVNLFKEKPTIIAQFNNNQTNTNFISLLYHVFFVGPYLNFIDCFTSAYQHIIIVIAGYQAL